jgi:hypothetical protein
METGLTKNQILSELSKSPHGKLNEYVAVGQKAAMQEPEFLAHLIAWDRIKGAIRDAKVALPVVSLSRLGFPDELAENSLAHMGMLGPREFLRAFRFATELRIPGRMRVRRLIEAYLRETEASYPKWERLAVQHRGTLKELYGLGHVKPSGKADSILFKGERPSGSVFEAIAGLKDMTPQEAAGTIMERRIPFLIAMGALGAKAKEPDLVLALIDRMSPTELVTNTKMLEKLGIKTNPALRGAYEQALTKASKSKKNVLKTTRAAEAIEDVDLKEKLRGLQEKQLASSGVEGNWLVLGDKSGSMEKAIESARQVAAVLAKMVKGKVWLVFFNDSPQTIDVTGASLDTIKKATEYIKAGGSTSIGCGLKRMLESNEEVDGIAIVSDAAENTAPLFPDVYKQYCEKIGKEVPVYLFRCKDAYPGHPATRDLKRYMGAAGYDLQEFDIQGGLDFYSLPNLVQTMRTNRYSLIDEVMATPLLTLGDVFKKTEKMEIVHA